MPVYYNKAKQRWHYQFKAVIDGERHRSSKLLPAGWSEAQARKYDQQETARTYARLAGGRRVSTIPLIEGVVAIYLEERVPDLADGHHAARQLALLLPHYRGKGLDQLGPIAREYTRQNRSKLAPATIRQRLALLRAAAAYALKHHSIGTADWVAQMSMPSVDNARQFYLKRPEILRLARACTDPGTRALILMTFATGSRPGELHRARRAGRYLEVDTKNGDTQRLPIHPKVRYLLRHWPMKWAYGYYHRRFIAARKALGLDHIHLHDLRHSTASALANAGVGLLQVGKVLGHRSVQATNRYAHLYPEQKAEHLSVIWTKKSNSKKVA